MLATQAGYRVRYFETAALVLMLKAAAADGKLEQVLKDVHRADLLIIDEFGYLPVDVEGARLLYQVMAATYESRSMIVTTNIEFSRWVFRLTRRTPSAWTACARSRSNGRASISATTRSRLSTTTTMHRAYRTPTSW